MSIPHLAILSISALTLMSASAQAQYHDHYPRHHKRTAAPQNQGEFFFHPYVGAEYQFTHVDYDDIDGINGDELFEDSFHGGGMYVGARIHENLSAEVSYSVSSIESKNNIQGTLDNSEIDFKVWSLDVLGHHALDAEKRFEVIGMLGIGYSKSSTTFNMVPGLSAASITIKTDENDVALRTGVGMQYEFTDNWRVRSMARSQFYGDADLYSINLGVNYTFN